MPTSRAHPLTARPRVAVVGVGAIGTTLAGALDHHAEVFLCRRGRLTPMRLRNSEGERLVHATTWGNTDAATEVDWVVVATKAQDTYAAGAWLDETVGPRTRIVVAQNGIDHAARVRAWADASRVVPSTVFIAAERTGQDTVTVTQTTALDVPDTAAARDFAALVGAAIPVHVRSDFIATSWEKLVMNAALNSITALTDMPVAVLSNLGARDLCLAALHEGATVAAAAGVTLASDVRSILEHLRRLPADAVPSMLADMRAGRATERAYLSGALIEAGQALSVETPTLAVLDRLLQVLESGHDRMRVS